ncbi:hypothetical protein N9N66_04120 [Schleiferiaceae bacterium]|nr:hypothetical protein [Schleiferiaceae bacterium]
MKKLFILFLLPFVSFAQSSDGFSYSAIIRDAQGAVLPNTTVGIEVTVLADSTSGSAVYSETHNAVTDGYGVVALIVGNGTVQSGSLSGIDWGASNHYLEVGIDLSGGSNYAVLSTTQIMSVPYALHARKADTANYVKTNQDALKEAILAELQPKNYEILDSTFSQAWWKSSDSSHYYSWDGNTLYSAPKANPDSISSVVYSFPIFQVYPKDSVVIGITGATTSYGVVTIYVSNLKNEFVLTKSANSLHVVEGSIVYKSKKIGFVTQSAQYSVAIRSWDIDSNLVQSVSLSNWVGYGRGFARERQYLPTYAGSSCWKILDYDLISLQYSTGGCCTYQHNCPITFGYFFGHSNPLQRYSFSSNSGTGFLGINASNTQVAHLNNSPEYGICVADVSNGDGESYSYAFDFSGGINNYKRTDLLSDYDRLPTYSASIEYYQGENEIFIHISNAVDIILGGQKCSGNFLLKIPTQ